MSDRKVTTSYAQRKFTISHNNMVEPNFHSESYQEEARNSFKKRMQYNPMEAAKKRPNLRNHESEYSQNRPVDRSMDVANVMRQV